MNKLSCFLVFIIFISLSFVSGKEDFSVNALTIKAVIKEGNSINYSIDVLNLNERQEFNAEFFSKFDFVSIDKKNFVLGKNETAILNIVLKGDYGKGVYVGKLIVSEKNDSITIPVLLEVESELVLVDVASRTAPKFFFANPGGRFVADVSAYNLNGQSNDVELEYYISDLLGNIIIFKAERLSIDYVGIRKSFILPENIEYGDYVFYIYARRGSSLGTSSLLFNVAPDLGLSPAENRAFDDYFSFVVAMLIALIFVFIVFNHFWSKKLVFNAMEWRKKVDEIKRIKFSSKSRQIRKLVEQRRLLDIAYGKKYIKKESYEEGRKKIDELIKRLRTRGTKSMEFKVPRRFSPP